MTTGITVGVGPEGALVALKGVAGYSVNEESTPVDPSDTSGATGKVTISGLEDAALTAIEAKRLYRKSIRLEDLGQGFTTGIIRLPSVAQKQMSVMADSRLVLLNARRQAQPYNGFLTGYVEYLLSLVGITDRYVIDPSFDGVPAVFPGWNDDVWLQMKALAASKGAEVSLASGNIVFRPLRGRIAVGKRDFDVAWSADDGNLALSVEGYWYETEQRANSLAYPPGGWSDDVQVYQVDAGEVVELDLPIDASLTSVQQPVAMDYVDRNHMSSSVYCIQGADGLPLPAAQWRDGGGRIEVSVGEDTRSLVVRITGANLPRHAPFRIAATAGVSDTYSSLRLVGTGVFFAKHLLSRGTSATEDVASQEVGAVVDTPFITSLSELVDRLSWTRARYSGPRHSISIRTKGIHRKGDSGSYSYPTFDDFNAYAAEQGWTIADDLNGAAPGLGWGTIDEFNEWWAATTADDFENQAFGNVAGARVFRDGLWFRIRPATITPSDIQYTAENDTTADDFNAYAAEQGWATIDDLNAAWAGATFDDFNMAPLTGGMP